MVLLFRRVFRVMFLFESDIRVRVKSLVYESGCVRIGTLPTVLGLALPQGEYLGLSIGVEWVLGLGTRRRECLRVRDKASRVS